MEEGYTQFGKAKVKNWCFLTTVWLVFKILVILLVILLVGFVIHHHGIRPLLQTETSNSTTLLRNSTGNFSTFNTTSIGG